MADTTTVRVCTSTRDALVRIGAEQRLSADEVIAAAVAPAEALRAR